MKKILFLLIGILMFITNINAQTIFTVTKTGDYDPYLYQYNYIDSLCDTTMYGTWQWAIRKANDTPGPCEIHFAIAGAGPHTIFLSYEIPVLINITKVDGTTQAGYQYGQPSVIIDGQNLISTGIYCYNQTNPVIKGLHVQNFTLQGILFNQCQYGEISDNIITGISNGASLDATMGIRLINSNNIHFNGNYIGTDFSKNTGMGCDDYGILIQAYVLPQQINSGNNFIGGSGLNQGNIIADNGYNGIWIAQSTNNLISRNEIFNNPVAIRLTQKANKSKPAPVITSFNGNVVSGTSVPNDNIEIFGSTGNENANEYIGTTQANGNGDWTTSISTTFSNVICTATDVNNNTSVLSITKPIENIVDSLSNLSPNGVLDTIFDRFGNQYSLNEIRFEKSQDKSLTSMICGGFEVFVEVNSGMEDIPANAARRAVLCQVLNDLSDFLNVSTNTNKVNIWFRDFANTGAPSSVLAAASPLYVVPAGIPTIGGIVDNQVWKTLISNVDAYTNTVSPLSYLAGSGFYHCILSVNYTDYSNLNTNLSNTTCSGLFDLYTILLHEMVHNLGFNSLINDIGNSQLGVDRNYKSRYDLFLQACNSSDLLNTIPTPASGMYNFSFNSALNPSFLLTGVSNCSTMSDYCGNSVNYFSNNVNQIVFTPPAFNPSNSLSHFEDFCILPPQNDTYFVMSNSTGTATVKRFLKPEEKNVLCDLGYNVQSTYGSVANHTWMDYGTPCSSGMVVGINDGINSSAGYSFVFSNSSSALTISPITNDFGSNIRIEGFQQIIGTNNGTINTTLTTATILPNSPGLNVYRYVPYNYVTGARGNITYVFAFFQDNCSPNVCDLVNNGNFEAVVGCGQIITDANLSCWYRLWNTADYYRRFCLGGGYLFSNTHNGPPNDCYLGMGSYSANSPEVVQTLLSSPLIPGENYILSFVAQSYNNVTSGWLQDYINIFFASSPTILPVLPVGFFINPNPAVVTQIVPYSATEVQTIEGWRSISIPFTFNGTVMHNNLIVGNNTHNSDGFNSYLLIDDISITPANSDATVTIPSCISANDPTSFTSTSFNTTSWLWDFGDQNSSTLQNPTHTYVSPGHYTVSLTVSNSCSSETISQDIDVIPNCCASASNVAYTPGFTSTVTYASNTPWTSNLRINAPVIVQAPAILTVNSGVTIEFGPLGKIIVENGTSTINGAQLVMQTNSKLTSITPSYPTCHVMWQGVEVSGVRANTSSILRGQGKITMAQGATIENAHIAVFLGKTFTCPLPPYQSNISINCKPWDYAHSGGIINANGASFINNAVSIRFLPYSKSNTSRIQSCTFSAATLLDLGYKTGNLYTYPNEANRYYAPHNLSGIGVWHVHLWNVQNINFYDNTFNLVYNEAILAFDSRFNVRRINTGNNFNNSVSTSSSKGIHIINYTSSPSFFHEISGNSFNMPFQGGIHIEGNQGSDLINGNNQFNNLATPNPPNYTPPAPIGIWLTNSSGFNIYQNNFNMLSTGIRVDNSGIGGGNIGFPGGNNFTRCATRSILTTGTIGGSYNPALQIKCNNFNNDIPYYFPTGSFNIQSYGVTANQGSLTTSDDKMPAGNEFLQVSNPPNPSIDKNQIFSLNPYVYYRHHRDAQNGMKILPDDVGSTITIYDVNVNKTNTSCINDPCLPPCSITLLNTQAEQLQTLKQEFNAVFFNLDKGQTAQLISAINTNTPSGQLKNMLINNSPLSDEVLFAFINRQISTPPGIFKEAITPNMPVSDTVNKSLLIKLNTIPSGIANQIRSLQGNNPGFRTLTSILREISTVENDRAQTLSQTIGYYVQNDSINTLTALLENEGTDYANQLLTGLYLSEGNLGLASSKLSLLPNSTPAEQAYKNINNVLITLALGDETVFEMDSIQEQMVRQIATMNTSCLARTNARAILLLVYNERFEEEMPQQFNARMAGNNSNNTELTDSDLFFSIYPNPASENVELHYNLTESEKGLLEIYSVIGKKVASYMLPSAEESVNISVKNFDNGIYMYRFSVNGELFEEGKLIIINK